MLFFFFFNDTATTEIYTLSLHDALPICWLLVPGKYLLGCNFQVDFHMLSLNEASSYIQSPTNLTHLRFK